MELKATFKAPRLDLQRYKKELQSHLGDTIAQAAFEWLSTVTKIVPVWSGASQATFLHLANQISMALNIAPVTRTSGVSLGLSEGEGRVDADPDNGRFTFTYRTTLFYLIYNEFNNANLEWGFHLKRPGPYHFQKAGQEAFEKLASTVRLPTPFKHLNIKTIKVG